MPLTLKQAANAKSSVQRLEDLGCCLDLKFNGFKDFVEPFPENFGKLISLEYLNLSDAMDALPESLLEDAQKCKRCFVNLDKLVTGMRLQELEAAKSKLKKYRLGLKLNSQRFGRPQQLRQLYSCSVVGLTNFNPKPKESLDSCKDFDNTTELEVDLARLSEKPQF